jgi:urea transport system ATP-binding protein
MTTPLLSVENLTVSFDGFNALDGISLQLLPTSIRVLIGPNGAGKSTLLDAIIGHVRPAAGRVLFKGSDITNLSEYKIVRRGICRKFQAPGVLNNLTVLDNLQLAARRHRQCWRSFGMGVARDVKQRVERILELIGLSDKRKSLASQLSHGQKQWLEIGMVVSSDADLLLLDEPAAGMSPDESAQTAELIRSLSSQHSFLVIDHDMTFVEQLRAPVSVMHMGRMLKEGSLEEIQRDPQVLSIYLGREKEIVVA